MPENPKPQSPRDSGQLQVVSQQHEDGSFEISVHSTEINLKKVLGEESAELEAAGHRSPTGAVAYIALAGLFVILGVGAWFLFISPGSTEREPPLVTQADNNASLISDEPLLSPVDHDRSQLTIDEARSTVIERLQRSSDDDDEYLLTPPRGRDRPNHGESFDDRRHLVPTHGPGDTPHVIDRSSFTGPGFVHSRFEPVMADPMGLEGRSSTDFEEPVEIDLSSGPTMPPIVAGDREDDDDDDDDEDDEDDDEDEDDEDDEASEDGQEEDPNDEALPEREDDWMYLDE